MHREVWRRNYQDGDLVLTICEGRVQVMVVTQHSGDGHHVFVPITVANSETAPDTHHHMTAIPEQGYTGYYIGPSVGRLDRVQLTRVGNGIDVPKLVIDATSSVLEQVGRTSPNPMQLHYTT